LGAALALGVLLCIAGPALAAALPPSDDAVAARQVLLMLPLPPDHLRPGADYVGAWGDGMGRSARRRAASALARANGLTLVDDWLMPEVGVDCFVLVVPEGQSPIAVAAHLSRAPGVAWSQPVSTYRTRGEPAQGGRYLLAEPTAREWRLANLHEVTTGRNVRVAVIDSRVDQAHPNLAGQVELSENFVTDSALAPELHGTAVAGIIAANPVRGQGVTGVAPGARLLALRACRQTPSPANPSSAVCDSLSLARALEFAIGHHAQVINMSLGGPPDPLLAKLLDVAAARRIAVVAAFDRDLPKGGFPASHPGVVAVADETWASPPSGVFRAPGDDVPTTSPGGRYSLVSGSSFSAAQVSGLIALARERAASPVRLAVYPGGGLIDACATVFGSAHTCGVDQPTRRDVAATVRR
jgi:hypothetical protein